MRVRPSLPTKLRILYITGWGRSGSTIVGEILGQLSGFFHGGEIRFLGERVWGDRYLCGCGEPLRECKLWLEVTAGLEKSEEAPVGRRLADLQLECARTRNLPSLLSQGHLRMARRQESRLVALLAKLYGNIMDVTGAKWIVDSSKAPSYGRVLEMIPGAELYVLHLIRDPRGTGFSWRKLKYDAGTGHVLERYGLFKNAVLWIVWNVFIEALWAGGRGGHKYLQLRYEDFAKRPRETLQAVLEFLGAPQGELPLISSRDVALSPSHTVAGNPLRLERGRATIVLDEEWRKAMKWHHKAFLLAMTWPLLLRYGYPLWS
jgi:hypothetical protein